MNKYGEPQIQHPKHTLEPIPPPDTNDLLRKGQVFKNVLFLQLHSLLEHKEVWKGKKN